MFDTQIFVDALKNDVVEFIFLKKDGTLRYAKGTTDLSEIPTENHPKSGMNETPLVKRYFDFTVNGWRSVVLDNLVWISGEYLTVDPEIIKGVGEALKNTDSTYAVND